MAARLNPRHQDSVRLKIQADRLIEWLQAGVFGSKFQGKDVALTTERVSAAKTLLNKALPDLTKSEHSGPNGGPIPVVSGTMTPEQAAQAYKEVMK